MAPSTFHRRLPRARLCLVRLLWLLLPIMFSFRPAEAQTFDTLGNFVPAYKGTSYKALTTSPPIQTPVPKLDTKALKALRKKLLERVNTAIFNLEDDSLKLSESYDKIWNGFTATYLQDLKKLRQKLLGTGNAAYTYNFLPDYLSLDGFETFPIFKAAEDKKAGNKTMQVFNLIRTDPLADYLLKHYKSTYTSDPITARMMDFSYVADWRKLEAWYALCKRVEASSLKIKDDIFNYRQKDIDDMTTAVGTVNPAGLQLVADIKASTFLRSWLWYTGGLLNINPLQVTEPEKRYPYTEKNTFFTAQKQRLQDSLNKSSTIDDFKKTAKYYNRLFLPIVEANKSDTYWLQEYDASKNYISDSLPPELTLDNKQQLRLAVYNIPASKKVAYTGTPGALVYESGPVIALNKAADQIGAITSLGTGNISTFTKVARLFNPTSFNPVQMNFAGMASVAGSTNLSMMKAMSQLEGLYAKAYTETGVIKSDSSISMPGVKRKRPERAIIIGGQWVPLTKKDFDLDKRRIIWVSAITSTDNPKPDTTDPLFAQMVEHFIVEDAYYFLDYNDIENAANDLVGRFNDFQDTIHDRYKKVKVLQDKAETAFGLVYPYVRISNRSLPVPPPDAVTDTVPVMRTSLNTPKLSDAPAKITYTVTEQGADGKDAAKEVTGETLNIIQTSNFDVSIGMAWTGRDYYIAQDGQPLPTSALGDRFQFTGGVHWYPFGRINRLHEKFARPFEERFSLYAGLSIAHALDNYFTGLSYDWVPGIKTVAGYHFYKNYHYKIVNNTVADKATGIAPAWFFVSLNLEPVTIIKAIGLFK